LPADPSSVRVYQDSIGHWYAGFVVPAPVEPLPETGAVIGIDWGVKETATTTSDAHDLPHAEHGRKTRQKLTGYDRMMARRKPKKGQAGSKGYREAKKWRAKSYAKVARQRQDTGRKWAKKVVTDHDAITVEDFKPKFLARTTMARKAADAAIGATKRALMDMARKHGRIVHLVHPAHHDGLRALRSESQARTAAVGTNVYLHRVRNRLPQRQELRPRDARPGWSQPGWCRGRKTSGSAAPGGSLSQESPHSSGGGFKYSPSACARATPGPPGRPCRKVTRSSSGTRGRTSSVVPSSWITQGRKGPEQW